MHTFLILFVFNISFLIANTSAELMLYNLPSEVNSTVQFDLKIFHKLASSFGKESRIVWMFDEH